MKRTALQAKETREALLRAALEVILENGGSDPSLEKIASRAMVTRGALYFHFRDKRALLEEVCKLTAFGIDEELPTHRRVRTAPLERLRCSALRWIEEIEENKLKRDVLDVVLHKLEWTPDNRTLRSSWEAACTACREEFLELLLDAERQGQFTLPSGLSAAQISGSLHASLLGLVSLRLRSPGQIDLCAASKWLLDGLIPRQ